jgi:large subunit ribosomal protein L21
MINLWVWTYRALRVRLCQSFHSIRGTIESMYAVIETGGKQYRVAPGDTVQVETLPGEVGAEIELGRVLAVVGDDAQLLTGDRIANAKVRATIKGGDRADKILVFKFKRKKQYKRTIGHRQNYTEVTVNEILI